MFVRVKKEVGTDQISKPTKKLKIKRKYSVIKDKSIYRSNSELEILTG